MELWIWGQQQRYLVEVAEMANPEDLPGDLVEAEAEAEVVPLPGVLDNLAAVDVGGHDGGGDRVAEPLLLLGAVLEPPRLHGQPARRRSKMVRMEETRPDQQCNASLLLVLVVPGGGAEAGVPVDDVV